MPLEDLATELGEGERTVEMVLVHPGHGACRGPISDDDLRLLIRLFDVLGAHTRYPSLAAPIEGQPGRSRDEHPPPPHPRHEAAGRSASRPRVPPTRREDPYCRGYGPAGSPRPPFPPRRRDPE